MKSTGRRNRVGWLGRLAQAGALALAVGACDSFREELGLTKQQPDEFSVVTKPPLILPPDYTLRPPRPGAPRPQELAPRQQARAALARAGQTDGDRSRQATLAGPAGRASTGELALLEQAGATGADPAIRQIVNQETSLLVEKDKNFTDRLIFWQTQPPFGTVVDAEQEAKRLRENAAIGKSVSDGPTPTIERRKRAIFEGIF